MTLLVRQAGLPTRDVVTAGSALHDDALLVLAGDATTLATLDPTRIDDSLLRNAWGVLGHLGELRIAHQQIDAESIVLVDGAVGFVDFGGATVTPLAEQLAVDRAQLLATTAALAGPERALGSAVAALGPESVAALLPCLQGAAFSSPLRRALKQADIDVDELRERAAEAVGAEPPELVKLRRVSTRSAVQIALLGLASYSILTAASGVDWGEVRTSIANATWAWVAAAFVVAQLPRFTQAISTMGPVPAALSLGPVYGMQLATGYMNVALRRTSLDWPSTSASSSAKGSPRPQPWPPVPSTPSRARLPRQAYSASCFSSPSPRSPSRSRFPPATHGGSSGSSLRSSWAPCSSSSPFRGSETRSGNARRGGGPT